MFTGVRVDHAALDESSSNLLSTATGIEGRLDQLEAELEPLRSGWGGAAQESYRAAKLEWDTAMTEMVQLLRDFSTVVQDANDAYRAADQRGARRFG